MALETASKGKGVWSLGSDVATSQHLIFPFRMRLAFSRNSAFITSVPTTEH